MTITYPLVEKFISINGEGPKAGMMAAFLRMKGCNLSCNYCDTAWANEPGGPAEHLGIEEILRWLKESGTVNVTLTGGEPLLVPEIGALIEALGKAGFSVEIETNGSVPLDPFCSLSPRPAFTMDYKCPDSDMEDSMDLDNFSLLTGQDSVKFVVSSERDLERAREITEEAEEHHEVLVEKPVQIAVEEFENGEYKMIERPRGGSEDAWR